MSSRPSRTPARTLRPARTSSRPCRLLQVPDGRHDHCRPQTSIATLLRRFSVTALAHRAHSTSHHHNVRQSPHRRSPVERALVKPWHRPSSREGTVSRLFENFDGDGHVSGVLGMCAPTKPPTLDLSARTHYRGARLERWLAQFWNEVRAGAGRPAARSFDDFADAALD
jgi:hypothetical protein